MAREIMHTYGAHPSYGCKYGLYDEGEPTEVEPILLALATDQIQRNASSAPDLLCTQLLEEQLKEKFDYKYYSQ